MGMSLDVLGGALNVLGGALSQGRLFARTKREHIQMKPDRTHIVGTSDEARRGRGREGVGWF
jgi:hypothetical protein